MTATEILKNEPKIILMVLETAEKEIHPHPDWQNNYG